MRCDDVRGEYLAGELSEAAGRHLTTCAVCSRQIEALDGVRAELRDPALWQESTPDLEEAVVAAVTSAGGGRAARSWRRIATVAAVAAAVVVAGVAWGLTRGDPADWEVPLAATDRSPGAAATVRGWNTSWGTRLAIDLAGLDPAPEGFLYELWFSRDEVHLSAGSFAAGDRVDLAIGVARRDFPRIWITLEPIDADESPSGVTLLDSEP